MIMPQTGPRPVYKAPVPPPGAAARRSAPGRPVPGQPIFQRTARPAAPGSRVRRFVRVNGVRCIRHALHPRSASAGCRSGSGDGAAGTLASGKPAGSSLAPTGTAICSARHERRPDEGLHSAAAYDGQQRTAADHAEHHDHRGHLGEGPGREAGHSREGCDCAAGGARRVRDHQPNARCGTGQRNGALLRRGYRSNQLRRADCEGDGRSGRERRRRRGRLCRVHRSSPSWAMSITARRRCWTRSA